MPASTHPPRSLAALIPRTLARLDVAVPADLPVPDPTDPDEVDALLARLAAWPDAPPWLAELARLELAAAALPPLPDDFSPYAPGDDPVLNPTLDLVELSWQGLTARDADLSPEPGVEAVLVYRDPHGGALIARPATDEDLLAVKLVLEEIPPALAAREAGVRPRVVAAALERATGRGVVLPPRSRIRRAEAARADPQRPGSGEEAVAEAFTLQWHVTQACDLSCRHCYDRAPAPPVPFEDGLRLLDDLAAFCRERHVMGQVSFTGGNPLLHPRFFDLYEAAAERGLQTAILGNPCAAEDLERLHAIQPPAFFQTSLEGLAPHNDYIRGAGHFDRVMAFLDRLREAGIYSMIMLTLTRANLGQVLPLGEHLRGRADLFTYNRLSLAGEGAHLTAANPADYRAFCHAYLDAARDNPVLSLKDNLLNLALAARGEPCFGGCTGFGCGAAFNFLALTVDGTAHACRKFPSPVGNVLQDGLSAVYDSPRAARYRTRSEACAACELALVCGGCLAVTATSGRDLARERDPYCFKE